MLDGHRTLNIEWAERGRGALTKRKKYEQIVIFKRSKWDFCFIWLNQLMKKKEVNFFSYSEIGVMCSECWVSAMPIMTNVLRSGDNLSLSPGTGVSIPDILRVPDPRWCFPHMVIVSSASLSVTEIEMVRSKPDGTRKNISSRLAFCKKHHKRQQQVRIPHKGFQII